MFDPQPLRLFVNLNYTVAHGPTPTVLDPADQSSVGERAEGTLRALQEVIAAVRHEIGPSISEAACAKVVRLVGVARGLHHPSERGAGSGRKAPGAHGVGRHPGNRQRPPAEHPLVVAPDPNEVFFITTRPAA